MLVFFSVFLVSLQARPSAYRHPAGDPARLASIFDRPPLCAHTGTNMSSKKAAKAAAKGAGASSPSYFSKKDKSAGWWPSFEVKTILAATATPSPPLPSTSAAV